MCVAAVGGDPNSDPDQNAKPITRSIIVDANPPTIQDHGRGQVRAVRVAAVDGDPNPSSNHPLP